MADARVYPDQVANATWLVDKNGNHLGSAANPANPLIDADQIRAFIQAGQGFQVTTGLISSATNANLYGGLQLFANNIAKNVYIYYIDIFNINVSGDDQLRQQTAADAGLNGASPPAPVNLQPGNGTTSLVTINWTANGFTAGSALPGTLTWQGGCAANIHQFPFNVPGDGIFIAKGTVEALGIYNKLPTAANTFAITVRWVEF